jgi:hypothetical protein
MYRYDCQKYRYTPLVSSYLLLKYDRYLYVLGPITLCGVKAKLIYYLLLNRINRVSMENTNLLEPSKSK